jgi:iron(III) transport system permease protein
MGPDLEETAQPASSVSRPTWFESLMRRAGGFLVIVAPVLLLCVLVLYPLAAILIQSIFPNLFALAPNLSPTFDSLRTVFADRGNYQALADSMTLGLVSSGGAAVIGTAMAVIARRTDLPGRGAIDLLVWIVFFTPSFLVGEAWLVFMTRGGTLDHFIRVPDGLITVFFSPVGVAFLLMLKSFPFVYLAVSAALVWLGSEYEDAARIAGARPWRAWLQVNTPLLLPAILSGALIVFAEALSDFGTAATIAQHANIPLVTYSIYEAINTFPVDFSLAAALSLLLFLAVALALLGQARVLRSRSFQVISGRSRPARIARLGLWRWPAFAFVGVVLLCAFVIPLGECVLLSFEQAFGNGLNAANLTLSNYQGVLTAGSFDLSALWTSLRLAFGAATLVTLIGLPVAYIVGKTQIPGRRLLSAVTLVTISVPGIILASGYIFAWNSPYLLSFGIGGPGEVHLYGTIWILLAAYIGGNLPFSIRLNVGALQQVSASLIDAARTQGAGLPSVLLRIVIPLLGSGLASVWLLVFTGTMFELAASELLYPPGQPTMPIQILTYFNNFRIERGMALAMLNVAVVAVLVSVVRAAPPLWRGVRRMAKGVERRG